MIKLLALRSPMLAVLFALIIGAALGPLSLAALYQLTGRYTAGRLLLAALPLAGAAAVSFYRGPRAKSVR